jgi:hypothetical protein
MSESMSALVWAIDDDDRAILVRVRKRLYSERALRGDDMRDLAQMMDAAMGRMWKLTEEGGDVGSAGRAKR